MTRLPSLPGEKIIKALGKAGFEIDRQRGSHVYLKHLDGRATVILYIKVNLWGEDF